MYFRYLSIALFLLFVCVGMSCAATMATISGEVRFVEGSHSYPKLNTVLEFTADSDKYVVTTDAGGRYSLKVAANRWFHLTVKDFSACTLSRAPFFIMPRQRLILNLVGVHCPFIDSGNVIVELENREGSPNLTDEQPCVHAVGLPIWYTEQNIESASKLKLLVSFGHCTENKNSTTYYSLDPADLDPSGNTVHGLLQATVSVNAWTMRADEIVFNKESQVFSGIGHVTFEDGTGRSLQMKSATLSVSGPKPIFNGTP